MISQGGNGEIASRVRREEFVYALAREFFDGRADFGDRTDATEVIPVGGYGAASRGADFLLHDQLAANAGFQSL